MQHVKLRFLLIHQLAKLLEQSCVAFLFVRYFKLRNYAAVAHAPWVFKAFHYSSPLEMILLRSSTLSQSSLTLRTCMQASIAFLAFPS